MVTVFLHSDEGSPFFYPIEGGSANDTTTSMATRSTTRGAEVTQHLITHLVEWFQRNVPAGISISVDSDGLFSVVDEGGFAVSVDTQSLMDQPGFDLRQGAETALHSVLNAVQDFVSEHRAEPWPSSSRGFAMPRVEFDSSGQVQAGYFVDGWVLRMPDFALDP